MMRPVIQLLSTVLLLALPVVGEAVPRRVAVLNLANSMKDPAVDWLGLAVAETLTTKLNAVRALQLVERAQLYKVLQEQKLALSDLVDPSQAAKIGKLLVAEQVLLGAYSVFGRTVRFTVRFVDVATGAIVATSQANGLLDPQNPNQLWTALDQLAQAAVDSLNTRVAIVQGVPQTVPVPVAERITPTAAERARLARPPTTSLAALEAFGKGLIAQARFQWDEAVKFHAEATRLDPRFADAWMNLGAVLGKRGHYAESVRASEQALRHYEALGDDVQVAEILNNLGIAHEHQGRFGEALALYTRSLRVIEKLGDDRKLATVLTNIGTVSARQGHFADALDHFDRALRLDEKLSNEREMISNLVNIGNVHQQQKRFPEAMDYYTRALRVAERLGEEPLIALTLGGIGSLYTSQGRFAEGLAYHTRSLRINERTGDDQGVARDLHNIAGAYTRQRRYPEALEHYAKSLRVREKLGDEPGIALTLYNIGITQALAGRPGEGLPYLERAVQIAEQLGMAQAPHFARGRDMVREQAR